MKKKSLQKLNILKSIDQVRTFRQSVKGSVGFIPTMGYLHEGHISLVKLSQKQNDVTVVSIFVNPKQFASIDDFEIYPRNTVRDLSLLQKAEVHAAYLPIAKELYPKDYSTSITVDELSERLEGKSRPGHFKGVATIVTKLFNIIQPSKAYFGQKDAQQVVIIRKMVEDLNIPVEVIVGKTLRGPDGLALSSRNIFLTKKQRAEATVLLNSLELAQKLYQSGMSDFQAKFVKQYADVKTVIQKAVETYRNEVLTEKFPTEKHSFH